MIKCKLSCPTGKFDGCCFECELKETCEDFCGSDPSECGNVNVDEANLQIFEQANLTTLKSIADLMTAKKKLDEKEKELKDRLKEAMEKYGVKNFDSDVLKITYVAETTVTSIDSAKLKKKYPAIADECSKVSSKAPYIRVEIKGGE
jgi:hypothetical protein